MFSQNGEDGILSFLAQKLAVQSKTFVEFGVQTGEQRNTRLLQQEFGWKGLLLDGSHENARINLHQEFITPASIIGILEKHTVSKSLGLLSVDIDSYDFWVLKTILEGWSKPDLIVVEVNSQIAPGLFTVPPPEVTKEKWIKVGTLEFGATPEAFAALGAAHGYKMVYCEKRGVNCFLVRNELLAPEHAACIPAVLREPPRYVVPGKIWKSQKNVSLAGRCQPRRGAAFYELRPDNLAVKNTVVPTYAKECLS